MRHRQTTYGSGRKRRGWWWTMQLRRKSFMRRWIRALDAERERVRQ